MTVALEMLSTPSVEQTLEKGNPMAFSPSDPVSAYSLLLQLRGTRRRRYRTRWLSDWPAMWLPALLLIFLALAYLVTPLHSASDKAERLEEERAFSRSAIVSVGP